MSNFFTRASDFGYHFDSLPDYMKNNNDVGYHFDSLPDYMKNNNDVGRTVYDIAYLPPDSDDEIDLGLAYSIEEVEKNIRLHAKYYEPDLLQIK